MASASSSVIDRFMDSYYTRHYRHLAKCAKEICEEKLRGSRIQAILTYRAKTKESLEQKLQKRNAERIEKDGQGYKNESEIREDVIDLAGMRIALYFPNQRDVVADVIRKAFKDVTWVDHPKTDANDNQKGARRDVSRPDEEGTNEKPVEAYRPKFAGYEARHARVHFKENDAKKIADLRSSDVVEIQIVSVLVHAWAEVEHDITYKSIFDGASQAERMLLDCLNGLVASSELLLVQVYQLYHARITAAKNHFGHKHELGTFFVDRIGEDMDDARLDMLHKFLRAVEKDTPEALGFALEAIGFEADPDKKANIPDRQLDGIAEEYLPFQLSSPMRIPFCIMVYILSNISLGVEVAARHNTETEASMWLDEAGVQLRREIKPNIPDQTHSSKCKILLSSILWLQELSSQDYDWQQALVETAETEDERKILKWLFSGFKRYNILAGQEPDNHDLGNLAALWKWFDKQDQRPIFSFVFRISRMGVLRDLPRELALLPSICSSPGGASDSGLSDGEPSA